MTFYIDDVTVNSRLPINWKSLWADAAVYFRVYGEKEKRASAARRLKAIQIWQRKIKSSRAACRLTTKIVPALVQEQFTGTLAKVDAFLSQAEPLIQKTQAGLADTKKLFNVNINTVERLIFEAAHYMNIAKACVLYAKTNKSNDFITYSLDSTQSYAILPTGPTAQTDEVSYYAWNQNPNSFENPQILADTKPVPAQPGTLLTNFGCTETFVPYGFAVQAGRKLDGLTFTATDLKSAHGVIPSKHVDLRILGSWYRPFGGKLRLMNEPLLHDPAFVVPVPGKIDNQFKDPKYGNDATQLLAVTIEANTTRQFYALVKVPADAAPGMYKGAIEGKTADDVRIHFDVELQVLPFNLEPTPNAYSAFYRSYLADEQTKQKEGIHSWRKTPAQMEAELVNMGEHGMNTLNLYVGAPKKTDTGWDFSTLDMCLGMAQRAGLTRSPFTWLGHNVPFKPDLRPGREDQNTWDKVMALIKDRVTASNDFCREKGYPQPAFFGEDERSGEALARLKRGYEAVNAAGGIVTSACYSDYWSNVGTAMTLPILMGGATSASSRNAMFHSQAAGLEVWIYNSPCTNMPATPSTYRRRYGLAMWRNGENGAAPWEYSGTHYRGQGKGGEEGYGFKPDAPVYAFAFPTWSGKPIDSIIFEAYREGIYDTRYMATLEKALAQAKTKNADPKLMAKVQKWLDNMSVNDDLQKVRRQMVNHIMTLQAQ